MAGALVATTSPAFDVQTHSVPPGEILSGGPPKDGIPAIHAPRFLRAADARFLRAADRVVGLALEGVHRAYPLRILTWHEIVNDQVGRRALAITYCPLTGSALVFDRTVAGTAVRFGVSGRLYRSNLLMYDHESESLWSQLQGAAVTGLRTGTSLGVVPAVVTTWAAWRDAHPDTDVLSTETGAIRDYEMDPYAGYDSTPRLAFPVGAVDSRLPAKTRVMGVTAGDVALAFPVDTVRGATEIVHRLGSTTVRASVDPRSDAVVVTRDDGTRLPAIEVYWFAWAAFHPDSAIAAPPAGTASDPPRSQLRSPAAYRTTSTRSTTSERPLVAMTAVTHVRNAPGGSAGRCR